MIELSEDLMRKHSPVHHPLSQPFTEQAPMKLSRRLKKLEGFLKEEEFSFDRSRGEEPEAQWRKIKLILRFSKQGLVTPPTTKARGKSGEEQVEDIAHNTLDAANSLKVAL
ncbi:hypothetical protein Tco_1449705 [Tanacetum coccineum]